MNGQNDTITTLRLKFERFGPVRYIGHLDMLRYFQKAVMRAGINIRYSEGFNPHQIMSFAYPLGVSMETCGDYLDIDVLGPADCGAVTEQMNSVMSEGIKILKTTVVPKGAANAMASVKAADYLVYIRQAGVITEDVVKEFLQKDEILVPKENGKKQTTVDIRPGIYDLDLRENDTVFMKLESGSERNIKVSTVLDVLSERVSMPVTSDRVIRQEIYGRNEQGHLVPLELIYNEK